MSQSMAEQVALLPEDQRTEIMEGLDPDAVLADWSFWGRPEQFAPEGWWAVWLILSGRGFGKPLTEGTPIVTDRGWVTMGEIRVGDRVFAHDGSLSRVTKVYRPSERETYRVLFDDGSHVDAGKTHEWLIFGTKARSRFAAEGKSGYASDWWKWASVPQVMGRNYVLPDEDILVRAKELRLDGASWREVERVITAEFPHARPQQRSRVRIKKILEDGPASLESRTPVSARTTTLKETHQLCAGDAIPVAGPLEFPQADLPVDPYVFGAWLGDGNTKSGVIGAGRDDWQHFAHQLDQRGYNPIVKQVRQEPRAFWAITSKRLRDELKSAGVYDRKHVPAVYLTASIEQRLDLLRGLMDTDGTVEKKGVHCGAGFVNKDLADAVYDLAVSLGFVARRSVRTLAATEHQLERPFYGVSWRPSQSTSPFLLARKTARIAPSAGSHESRKSMRRVVSVERVEDQDLVCIAIDHPSQLFLAGRALIPTHNTRAGAEWVRQKANENPGCRIILLGRTAADVRDVMVGGDSGIMAVCPDGEKPEYFPSKRLLVWPNGSTATLFSATEPDQLRGPQAHYAWCDEVAAFPHIPDASGLTAWDNARIATRLGEHPQLIATTTPKRVPVIKDLLKIDDGTVAVTRGSTKDNKGNLSSTYLDVIYGVYAGSHLASQELEGILTDEVDGALWSDDLLNGARALTALPALPFRVVAVDPSVSATPKDECGIVVVGATGEKKLHHRHAYVLEDATVHGSPDVWAKKVVETARRWKCAVVAEGNQGGDLVRMAIHSIDPSIQVFQVTAKKNKQLRAEPVVAAYEQKRVHHVGYLATLEAQQTSWVPAESKKSPDRVDAVVYGVQSLLIDVPKGLLPAAPLRAKSPARSKIKGVKSANRRVMGIRNTAA